MPTYGNQHITQISRVQLPEIAQDPDLGVKYCNTPFPVVASETKTDRLYNDKKGVFVKRSDANDGITFTLEKDGVDIVPLGDYIGLPYDPLVVAFVIDWRQHLINHGAGCYRLRVNYDIAGVTGEYYEGAYELMPYGTHTVIETVRLFSYFDSFHSAKGVNFKDSGFHSSVRFGGRFGNRQPNTEINNIKHTDNIQRKIRRENINSYELVTDPLLECFTKEILDFHLVGENEIFVTDNDAYNHSYRYRDYPVILSDTPEMNHTSGRPSGVTATFEDKQLNEYTSYVSSQDPNVIEPPVCDPASVTVNNSGGTQVDSGTVVSGGSGTFTAPDGTSNINQSDGTLLQAVNIPSGDTVNTNIADSVITLKDTATNVLSTTNVLATDPADIVAPDATFSIVDSAASVLYSGNVLSGGNLNQTINDATVNVNKSDGVLISAVSVVAEGLENYNVADSVVTVNSQSFESVKATGSFNIITKDDQGTVITPLSIVSPDIVFNDQLQEAIDYKDSVIADGGTVENEYGLVEELRTLAI